MVIEFFDGFDSSLRFVIDDGELMRVRDRKVVNLISLWLFQWKSLIRWRLMVYAKHPFL